MSRRRTAECKLYFVWNNEQFHGVFDQHFYIHPAEEDVGISQPYCQLDSDPEDLQFYDEDDTLIAQTYPEYADLKEQFGIAYSFREDCVTDQCWSPLEEED